MPGWQVWWFEVRSHMADQESLSISEICLSPSWVNGEHAGIRIDLDERDVYISIQVNRFFQREYF